MIRILLLSITLSLTACKSSRGNIEVENAPGADLPNGGIVSPTDPLAPGNDISSIELNLLPDTMTSFPDEQTNVIVTPSYETTALPYNGTVANLASESFPANLSYKIKVTITDSNTDKVYTSDDCNNTQEVFLTVGINPTTIQLCPADSSNVVIQPVLEQNQ